MLLYRTYNNKRYSLYFRDVLDCPLGSAAAEEELAKVGVNVTRRFLLDPLTGGSIYTTEELDYYLDEVQKMARSTLSILIRYHI